jgi:DNA-binding NarL/FixJ family response regulator
MRNMPSAAGLPADASHLAVPMRSAHRISVHLPARKNAGRATSEHGGPAELPSQVHGNKSMAEQSSEVGTPPVILYVDQRHFGRDCISEQLATHFSGWRIEPIASARELPQNGGWPRTSVVILNTHGASISTAEVTDELARIAEAAPGVPLVIISDREEAAEVLLATRLGSRGYLPACMPLAEVIGAIRLVSNGGTYIPSCVLAATSLGQEPQHVRPRNGHGNPVEFSPRELEVIALLQQGKQNKVIAYELGICESTAKVHIRHIMKKLDARNRTQVVLMTNRVTGAFSD